jgi:hypothetical protein
MSTKAILSVVAAVIVVGSLYYLFRYEEEKDGKEDKHIVPQEGGLGLSNEERQVFIPTNEWKVVEDNHICPAGLEYRVNLSNGSKVARIPQ